MIFLDTNYIIRFLTKDIEAQYQKARKIILNKENQLFVPTIVLAEVNYILQEHYQFSKEKVASTLTALVRQQHISTADFVDGALNIYQKETISFYDALILAEALQSGEDLKTFDKKLYKLYRSKRNF